MTSESNWTIPNVLTVARILLTPGFVMAYVNQRFDLAWWLFAVAGFTDALDGFLARVLHQRSRLGSMLDPLADKILLDTSFICLALQGWLPPWLAILVVSRDVIIVGGLMLLQFVGVDVRERIDPTLVSKLTTTAQIVLVLLVMIQRTWEVDLAELQAWLSAFTAAVTLWSGVGYVIKGFALVPSGDQH